jgi:probable rRNA maturation factor
MAYTIDVEVDEACAGAVDIEAIKAVAAAVLRAEGLEAGSLSIVFALDEEMHEVNLAYRGVDAPTDVLSFAAQEDAGADDGEGSAVIVNAPPELQALLAASLGDIMIAYPYAQRQAARFGNSTAHELLLLTVHGVLHLLGYDHATPEDEAAMWQRQEEILARFGVVGLSLRRHEE